jgi:hypothetical protein
MLPLENASSWDRVIPVSSSVRVLLLTLVVWKGGEAIVCAAEPPIAVAATVGLSSQTKGDSDLPYLGPPFGGTSLSGVFFVDVDVSARLSVGGEVSLGSEVKGDQQQRVSGGTNLFSSRHHDTIFSGVAKFTMLNAGPAQVTAVLGAGLGWRHTIRDGSFRSDRPPFGTTPAEQTLSNAVFATTLGFDGIIAVSPRSALVWTGRFHLLNDDDRESSGVVRRGVSSRVFRFGGGGRFRF